MKNKLLQIINHYGPLNQRKKLCEEFMELQDELFYVYDLGDDRENLLSEVADVLVLVMQFAYEYGYSIDNVINMMQYKIDRQLDRIEKENSNVKD
jgi:NTP pyrophosphatase (non-canonical NTP hydrolase)